MDSSFTAVLTTITSAMVSSLVTIRLFGMGKAKEHESRLFEKRSECYPLLYRLLSDFIKILEFGALTDDGLDKSLTKKLTVEHMRLLEHWDSAHAILANDYTIVLLLAYRSALYKLLEEDDRNFAQAFHLPDSPGRQDLIEQTRDLESSIRWEIRTHDYPMNEFRVLQQGRNKRYSQRRSYLMNQ